MDLLRFTTAGSVDDGKSTLIGRLLYDTNNVKTDILQSVSQDDDINLAHITDGLRAERQQGITIDVAYKYFSTKSRKYIITDAPGHFQYTRNLITGASTVDLMIILIDARNGITNQTIQHAKVASFLRTRSVVIAINKMDVVSYNEDVFVKIKNDFTTAVQHLNLQDFCFIPISALVGDNISTPSQKMYWYKGKTILQYLESYTLPHQELNDKAVLSVQYIQDAAVYGKILSGQIKLCDKMVTNPNREEIIVEKIFYGYKEVVEAKAGENICLYLNENTKVKRGDILTHLSYTPINKTDFETDICWLDAEHPLQSGKEYILRIHTAETHCRIISTNIVSVNEFAKIKIETEQPITYDHFSTLPTIGRGIIVDPVTNYTSGTFIIS